MLINIVAGVFLIWLAVLSYFVFKTRKHYFNLTTRTRKQNLDEILDKIIEDDQKLNSEITKIKKDIHAIIEDSKFHFQRMGLVRFNPFGRSAVDQSFVLALLNSEKSGIVINFIYTHEGVRVYAKRVNKERGAEHELSEEEKSAIDKSEVIR